MCVSLAPESIVLHLAVVLSICHHSLSNGARGQRRQMKLSEKFRSSGGEGESETGGAGVFSTESLINAFEFCSGFSVAVFVELPKQHAKMPCRPAGTKKEPVLKCAREIRRQ